jgi:hypothetical protein
MEKLKADAASKKSSVGLEHIEHTSDKVTYVFVKDKKYIFSLKIVNVTSLFMSSDITYVFW